ncbi:hypothetical protein DPEC_G00160330 [Dallia pectoralis]|uniref:Uncharacterized protein n=1 Tax=Dallia pectoralis TaxID=75939 RepID=A0ACC2GGH4_DALPE|nr:hypothetical protein DPEC_G00160330 [Dallia pectoralis]
MYLSSVRSFDVFQVQFGPTLSLSVHVFKVNSPPRPSYSYGGLHHLVVVCGGAGAAFKPSNRRVNYGRHG